MVFNPQSPGVYINEVNASTVVPRVGTTVGAVSGIFSWGPVFDPTLIVDANNYSYYFGFAKDYNYETWFTGRNFLDYGNTLFVVRTTMSPPAAVNSTVNNFPNCALTAIGGNGFTTADITTVTVASYNQATFQDFVDGQGSIASVYFAGRYPGALGNSLRIGTCYDSAQYSSVVTLSGSITSGGSAGNSYNGVLKILPGAKSGSFVFTATVGSNIAAGNLYANTLVPASFSVGDYLTIKLGDRAHSTQNLQMTSIGTAFTNSTATHINVTFSKPYAGGSNASPNTVVRRWEYASLCPAPSTGWISAHQANSTSPTIRDLVNVIVIDNDGGITGKPNTVLEVYNGLSRAKDSIDANGVPNFWKDTINHNSQWIRVFNDLPGFPANTANFLAAGSPTANPFNVTLVGGNDGDGESNCPLATLIDGWTLFQGTENIKVNLVMAGRARGDASSPAGVDGFNYSNYQMASWLIDNIAVGRGDCVVFFSPDKGLVVNSSTGSDIPTDLVNWASLISSSDRAVMDCNYKYQYDDHNNVYRWVPFNGDVAGLCARTDAVSYPWFSPAGFTRGQIKNVVRLAWNPQQGHRDFIYPNAINPIVQFPGQGVFLYGDRTFTTQPSAFDRINVRRLFLFMEQSIKIFARYTLFELNDVFTQNAFKNAVTPFLQSIESSRGITDFQVICDSTVNTPDVIDANQFLAAILVKPERSINFINITFYAVPTGVAFSTVSLA